MIDLADFIAPVTAVVCLAVGWILKNCTPIENRFIPLAAGILGVVLAVWDADFIFSPEILASGLVSGLASTGLHELIDNLIKRQPEEEAEDEDCT